MPAVLYSGVLTQPIVEGQLGPSGVLKPRPNEKGHSVQPPQLIYFSAHHS